jgi:hypothetical protein
MGKRKGETSVGVGLVEATREVKGKTSKELRYYLSSLPDTAESSQQCLGYRKQLSLDIGRGISRR